MVLVDKGHVGAGFLHRYQFTTKVVMAGSVPRGQVLLVVPVDIENGIVAGSLLHPVAVPVIDEVSFPWMPQKH